MVEDRKTGMRTIRWRFMGCVNSKRRIQVLGVGEGGWRRGLCVSAKWRYKGHGF